MEKRTTDYAMFISNQVLNAQATEIGKVFETGKAGSSTNQKLVETVVSLSKLGSNLLEHHSKTSE